MTSQRDTTGLRYHVHSSSDRRRQSLAPRACTVPVQLQAGEPMKAVEPREDKTNWLCNIAWIGTEKNGHQLRCPKLPKEEDENKEQMRPNVFTKTYSNLDARAQIS